MRRERVNQARLVDRVSSLPSGAAAYLASAIAAGPPLLSLKRPAYVTDAQLGSARPCAPMHDLRGPLAVSEA